MNYLILHYFFMVCICNRRIIVTGFSKRANNYDIDDFITQLLTSQKFDELAEKVADKAVNKIKNMETFPLVASKNVNENQHRYQEKKRKFDQQSLVIKDREQRALNDEAEKPVRINTQVLMKKEDESNESDALTLKYKFLKKHSQAKNQFNNAHSVSEEHNPVWRNVDHSDDKNNPKKMSDEGEQDEREGNQKTQFLQLRVEKNINSAKNENIDKNDSFDKIENINKNGKFDRNSKFDKNINFDRSTIFDKSINFDKNINFNKNENFNRNENFDKPINFDRNPNMNRPIINRNPPIEKNTNNNNFNKPINFDNINGKYQKHDDRNRFDRVTDNTGFKTIFLNDNGDERPTDSRNNDRARDDSNERYKSEFDVNRQTFQTEKTLLIPSRSQHKGSPDDSPPTIIDLDDNDSQGNTQTPPEEHKNLYRDIVEQQKSLKKEFNDDEANDDDHKTQDDDNGWREEGKIFGDDINSDNDSGYKKQRAVDDSPVTTVYDNNEFTTKRRLIRREGNQFFTYLSAPEYAEYHEALAKQTSNIKNPFDIQ